MLHHILEKSKREEKLSMEEIMTLLSQTDETKVELIYKAAREIRTRNFQHKVFLYGFVYFSTFCRNECTFCYFRKSNSLAPRYRKSLEEIVETARELKACGIHLIDLTTGEDPYYIHHPERLVDIIKAVKNETRLPVMISPGLLEDDSIAMVADAGADWYALYQETYRTQLFRSIRLNQSFENRIMAKRAAQKSGMLIEEGLLTGVGNSIEDTVYSLEMMDKIGASQVRSMTFIPQQGTPLEGRAQSGFLSELLQIAVMRILFPKALIPASLDVDGKNGLKERLQAGANVITSIIPPKKGFAGVAHCWDDIDGGHRTIEGIQDTIIKCGLENATPSEYQEWVRLEKEGRRRGRRSA